MEFAEFKQTVDEALTETYEQINSLVDLHRNLNILTGHVIAIQLEIDTNPSAASALSLANSIANDLTGVRNQYDGLAERLEEIQEILKSI